MQKASIIIFLLTLSFTSFSQDTLITKNVIEINPWIRWGFPGFDSYNIGLNYNHAINKKLDFIVGLGIQQKEVFPYGIREIRSNLYTNVGLRYFTNKKRNLAFSTLLLYDFDKHEEADYKLKLKFGVDYRLKVYKNLSATITNGLLLEKDFAQFHSGINLGLKL